MKQNKHNTQTYNSIHPKVQNDPVIKQITTKWEQITPNEKPTKWPLPIQEWEERLKNHPQKQETQEFIEQLKS